LTRLKNFHQISVKGGYMLTDQDVQELLHHHASHPVLSVYLNTDPAVGNADAYKLHLRNMLKEVDAPEDVTAVLRYFDHTHDWSGRSVAVFSCAAENFLRAFSLAVPVRSRVRTSDRPFVKPLADLLDAYGGYGVVLVDKQGARLFHFHLGRLVEQEGMMGEAIRHTKRGGGSQAAGRKGGVAGQTDYVEELADRNMKDAVDFAVHFFSDKNIRRIAIGGTEENVAQFRSLLPKAWKSLVVGSFPINLNATHPEVLERAMKIGEEAEHQRELHLVETVVTGAAKGRGGVIGLEDTLGAIREGRVQSLIIRDGFRAPGYRCKSCGHLSSLPMGNCPFCDGETEQIPDAVETAVRQVMATGGEIEVLRNGQTVKGFEQIGALLRY
jgi:peptide subunit release factor 1 (eRF1)